ncbi:hypothetical protein BBJ28_00013619 [Nothophytophthora sp. Chile5]|nr:hypothetical protein BBJ28_00013619 [Nothophytophthora sp. Chile5]
MISALVEMRFSDEDVKERIESADTNLKKRLAWQHFADRISEKLNVVLTSDQVVGKYKKLKCDYRKGTSSRKKTGNDGNEDDSVLWSILNSAFAGRSGILGALLGDVDDDTDYQEECSSFASPEVKKKEDTPITMLAAAMKDGMTAIASSLGGEDKTDDRLVVALSELKKSQNASRRLQEKQSALLDALINMIA